MKGAVIDRLGEGWMKESKQQDVCVAPTGSRGTGRLKVAESQTQMQQSSASRCKQAGM
jgi:2-phospho-L-lactate guanylyltransferase (CobY/MobA/RfbA family)